MPLAFTWKSHWKDHYFFICHSHCVDFNTLGSSKNI